MPTVRGIRKIGGVGAAGPGGTGAGGAVQLTFTGALGSIGVSYTGSLAASGGTPTYTYSILTGSLPPGLSLNTSTGAITGTPTTSGTYSFQGKVIDSLSAFAVVNCTILISTEVDDAPNVTAATCTITYQLIDHLTVPVFSGTTTMASSLGTLSTLEVRVVDANGNGTTIATYTSGFIAATPFSYTGFDSSLFETNVAQPVNVLFFCYNTAGVPAPSPFTVSATIAAATVTSISAIDNLAVGARWQQPGIVASPLHAEVDVSAVLSTYPHWVTIQTNSPQYGPINHGWFEIDSSATVIKLGGQNTPTSLFPPTAADETINVWLAIGTLDRSLDLSVAAGVGHTTTVVHAPAAYSSTAIGSSSAGNLTYGSSSAGANMYTIQVDFTLPLTDINFFFARLTIQSGKMVGPTFVPGGIDVVETNWGDWAGPTLYYNAQDHKPELSLVSSIVVGQIRGILGPWPVPTDGNNIRRLRIYLSTRHDDGSGGSPVLQNKWPGGADHIDFTIDGTKGQGNARLLDPTTIGPSLGSDPITGNLGVTNDNSGNVMLNPVFDLALRGWTVVPTTGASGSIVTVSNAGSFGGSTQVFEATTGPGGLLDIFQVVAVTPNTQYFIAEWWSNLGTDGTASVYVDYLASNQAFLFQQGLASITGGAGAGFRSVSANFTTPGNCGFLRVYGVLQSATGTWALGKVLLQIQPTTGSGLGPNGSGGVVLKYGAALGDDGLGNASVRIAAPLFADVTNNLNLRIASDFVVSGGQLTQNVVDLFKAINFDGTQFTKGSGFLAIAALAVNKLVAGDAVFAGDVSFAHVGGGKVFMNSGGIGLASDTTANPLSTVTLSANGISIIRGANFVAVTASGVSIFGPSGSLTASSGGIVIANTGVSISISANQVQMASSGGTLTLTSTAITIANGINQVSVTPGGVNIFGGSLNSPSINGGSLNITTANGTFSLSSASAGVTMGAGSSQVQILPGFVGVTTGGGLFTNISPGTIQMSNGGGNTILSATSLQVNGFGVVDSSGQLYAAGGVVVNSGRQFVGAGVNCPGFNVVCAGLIVGGFGGGSNQLTIRDGNGQFCSINGETGAQIKFVGGMFNGLV